MGDDTNKINSSNNNGQEFNSFPNSSNEGFIVETSNEMNNLDTSTTGLLSNSSSIFPDHEENDEVMIHSYKLPIVTLISKTKNIQQQESYDVGKSAGHYPQQQQEGINNMIMPFSDDLPDEQENHNKISDVVNIDNNSSLYSSSILHDLFMQNDQEVAEKKKRKNDQINNNNKKKIFINPKTFDRLYARNHYVYRQPRLPSKNRQDKEFTTVLLNSKSKKKNSSVAVRKHHSWLYLEKDDDNDDILEEEGNLELNVMNGLNSHDKIPHLLTQLPKQKNTINSNVLPSNVDPLIDSDPSIVSVVDPSMASIRAHRPHQTGTSSIRTLYPLLTSPQDHEYISIYDRQYGYSRPNNTHHSLAAVDMAQGIILKAAM